MELSFEIRSTEKTDFLQAKLKRSLKIVLRAWVVRAIFLGLFVAAGVGVPAAANRGLAVPALVLGGIW
jgi:hypothetical protein